MSFTSTAYKVPVPPWLSAKDWTATGTVRSDNSITGPAQIKETSSVPVKATLAAADAAQSDTVTTGHAKCDDVTAPATADVVTDIPTSDEQKPASQSIICSDVHHVSDVGEIEGRDDTSFFKDFNFIHDYVHVGNGD